MRILKHNKAKLLIAAVLISSTVAGCVVSPAPVVYRPGGMYCSPGYYGPYGGWHPRRCWYN